MFIKKITFTVLNAIADTGYMEELFEEFVVNIIVNSRDELTFNLKCGLSLKEKVVR